MKFIFLISFLPDIVLAYFIAMRLTNKFNNNIEEARESISKKELNKIRKTYKEQLNEKLTTNKRVKGIFERRSFKLKEMGNPFKFIKLTPMNYYILKLVPTLAAIVALLTVKNLILIPVIIFSLIYVDLKLYLNNKNDENEIKKDLPRVYNVLEVMTYADIQIDKTISELHEVIKNERLRNAFIELSAEITTTRNVTKSLENLSSKFKMREIKSFCLTINQGLETGKIREMISNQRKVLYKTFLGNKDIETSNSNLKITIAMLLMFSSIGSITIFSFINKIIKGLDFILK